MNRVIETPLPATALDTATAHKMGTIFPSLSRAAAAYTSDEMHNYHCCGARLFVDITNAGAAGTVTLKVQVQDPASRNWMDLAGAVTAALAAVATTSLTIYPGVTVANNVAISSPLGLVWRVVATVGGNAVVFSVGGQYLGAE